MKFDLTRQSLTNTVLSFLLILGLIWSVDFVLDQSKSAVVGEHLLLDSRGVMPLGKLIAYGLGTSRILEVAVSFFVLFINSFFIARIVIKNLIYSNRTYISAIVYLLVCIGMFNSSHNYISLIATLSLIFGVEKILTVSKRRLAVKEFFMGGVYVGLAAIIFAPLILLSPICVVSFVVFKRFEWREVVATVAGILLPLFLCAYTLWALGDEPLVILHDFAGAIRFELPQISTEAINPVHLPYLIFIGLVALMLLVSVVSYVKTINTFRTRAIKATNVFVWFLVFCLLIPPFTAFTFVDMITVLAIPVSVLGPLSFKNEALYKYNIWMFVLLLLCALAGNVLLVFL